MQPYNPDNYSAEILLARTLAFAAQVPDYEDVVSACNVALPSDVATFLTRSQFAPHLGYFLAKNRMVLERITNLPSEQALIELRGLERNIQLHEPWWLSWWAFLASLRPTAPKPRALPDLAPREPPTDWGQFWDCWLNFPPAPTDVLSSWNPDPTSRAN